MCRRLHGPAVRIQGLGWLLLATHAGEGAAGDGLDRRGRHCSLRTRLRGALRRVCLYAEGQGQTMQVRV